MLLHLIRHADAVDLSPDHARPLSGRGREQVKALARFLAGREVFAPAEIWHSPLVRARETAELLAKRLELTAPCRETAGFAPEDSPAAAARRLAQVRHDALAVVGHEPHLSALATRLVAGDAEAARFVFRKSTLLTLEGEGGYWCVRWMLAPELLA